MHLKEDAFLAKLIELRVAIQETSGDELVENTHDQWGKEGKKDIVVRKRPRFEDDLARKGVLKRILIIMLARVVKYM